MKKGKTKKNSNYLSSSSPYSISFYLERGFSEQEAIDAASIYAELDPSARELALETIRDLDSSDEMLPIKHIEIDGRIVPVIETTTGEETTYISALGYEGPTVRASDIEGEGPVVSLIKMSEFRSVFEREFGDFGEETCEGKKLTLQPREDSKKSLRQKI